MNSGISAVFILLQSCAGKLSCSKFLSTAVLCRKHYFGSTLSTSGPHTLCILSSEINPESWGVCVKHICPIYHWAFHWHLFSVLRPVMSVFIYCHPLLLFLFLTMCLWVNSSLWNARTWVLVNNSSTDEGLRGSTSNCWWLQEGESFFFWNVDTSTLSMFMKAALTRFRESLKIAIRYKEERGTYWGV